MVSVVSSKYAQALFEISIEKNIIDRIYNEVLLIQKMFEENEDYIKILTNPKINKKEKMELITSLLKGKVSDDIIGLFSIVISKSKEKLINEILLKFMEKIDEHKGIKACTVISYSELSDVQRSKLIIKIEKLLDKKIRLIEVIDKSIIGGLYIEVDGKALDGTVKGQLEKLKKQFSLLEIKHKGV